MGWQSGRAIGRGGKEEVVAKELVRRPQRLGLGATPAPETHQKKYIKPGGGSLPFSVLFKPVAERCGNKWLIGAWPMWGPNSMPFKKPSRLDWAVMYESLFVIRTLLFPNHSLRLCGCRREPREEGPSLCGWRGPGAGPGRLPFRLAHVPVL